MVQTDTRATAVPTTRRRLGANPSVRSLPGRAPASREAPYALGVIETTRTWVLMAVRLSPTLTRVSCSRPACVVTL
jgi:hypothetical protein